MPGISRKNKSVTIPNGAAVPTAGLYLGAYRVHAIQMPAAWTAANLTFQASADDVTYVDVYDNGTELSVTAAASRYIVVDPAKVTPMQWLKVRSGTTATPVNQGAARVLTLITVPVERS